VKKLLTIGVLVVAGMAVGCSSGKKQPDNKAANAADFAPPPPAPSHEMVVTPVPTPAGGGMVTTAGLDRPAPDTKLVDPAPVRGGGTKYVVKKGDTLWSIAVRTYNDGKQYKKIVAANPSIKGERVLVGQTIILP
jgi:nucleoid-associated protein YgaU